MTVKFYLFFALLGLSVITQAQTTSSVDTLKFDNRLGRHNVFLSGMFAGQVVSLNYEYHFRPLQRKFGVYAGVGFASTYVKKEEKRSASVFYGGDWFGDWDDIGKFQALRLAIPFGFNYMIGKKTTPNRFELGLGFTYVDGDVMLFDDVISNNTWLMNGTVAFRKYYFHHRVMWRVSFTPVVSLTGGTRVIPWGECSIGVRL
jgi:hypothetical protein